MDKDNDYGFSKITMEWLGGWLSGGKEITTMPGKVIEESRPYFMDNDKQVTLYKALKPSDTIEDFDNIYDFNTAFKEQFSF